MERNFTDENFERFLRQNADGLRMRPSDRVWATINRKLNQRRRRLGLLVAFSLLATAGTAYFLYSPASIPAQTSIAKTSPHSTQSQSIQPTAGAPVEIPAASPADITRTNTVRPSLRLIHGGQYRQPEETLSSTDEQAATTQASRFEPTVIDSYETNLPESEKKEAAPQLPAINPQTIESVTNLYHPHTSRAALQVYFTPTFSYRKLHDENINNVVTHKPDFGFELGLAAKYPIARNLRVVGGIQFNVNRYDIKTYNSGMQNATIRLRGGIDSLNAATSYNNFSGYQSNWLENFFFQISTPVGLEYRVKNGNHTRFGLAATLQPTYVVGDRAYLISSDYKNYAEVPRLISRWNVNTSLETFVAYGTGRLKWQVGPQVRYQLFSTYERRYPVKENLFDFGFKVGISLNNQ